MSETNYDSIFGKLVLDQGFCTEEEIAHCKRQIRDHSRENPITLEQLLISNRFITPNQARRIKEATKESKDVAEHIPGYKILGKLGAGQWLSSIRQSSLVSTVS